MDEEKFAIAIAIALEGINPQLLGLLLRQARKQRGMSQSDAAKVINVARTTVVAIEKGERRIKAGELIELARAYGRSAGDFIGTRPAIQPFQARFEAAYQWGGEGDRVQQIKPAILQLEQLCRNYLELEELLSAPLPQNYPPEYRMATPLLKASLENIATLERQRLGLGSGSVSHLNGILEQDAGLRIFYLNMPQKYSAIYTCDEKLGGCIAINFDRSLEEQQQSLAGAYFYFLARRKEAVLIETHQHRLFLGKERIFDAFSRYFLMPASGLFERFNNICRANDGKFARIYLFTLARYYGVPARLLARRLEEMGLLPSGTSEGLHDRPIATNSQRAERFPDRYRQLAIEALGQELISEDRFAELLNVDRRTAKLIAEMLRERSTQNTEVEA